MTDRSRIPPSGPVHFGIAGLRFGKTWARAAAWHPDSRLVAVCVPHQERADEFLAELQRDSPDTPPARYFATYEEMLAVPEIDAIGLFTPAPLHAAQAVAALEAGKHVLSAVPAAVTVDECRRVVEAVVRAERLYMMAENWLYIPTMTRARQLYEQGALGQIFYAEAEYIHDLRSMWRDAAGRLTWRWELPPLHYPTHGVAPYLQMTGDRLVEAVAVASSGETAGVAAPASAHSHVVDEPPAPGIPWIETALFRSASGAAFRLTNTFRNASPHLGHFYSFYGTRGTFETGRHREARHIALYHVEGAGTDGWTREECAYATAANYSRLVSGGHASETALIVDDFVRAVRLGEQPPIAVVAAMNMTLPGICGHQAAMEGRRVSVPDPRDWVPSGSPNGTERSGGW